MAFFISSLLSYTLLLFCLYCLYNNNICQLMIIQKSLQGCTFSSKKNREIVVKKKCRLFFHYIHAPFIEDEAIFKLRFCMKIE